LIAAFTVRLTVCLQITLEAGLPQRGRGLWKMNTKSLEDITKRSRNHHDWTRWRVEEGTGHGYVVGEIC